MDEDRNGTVPWVCRYARTAHADTPDPVHRDRDRHLHQQLRAAALQHRGQFRVSNLAGSINSNTVTATWTVEFAKGGAFVISDLQDINGHAVYWWGAQWWKKDHLSSGLAPAAFKGYETGNASPWCGQTWTTRPGNSPHPPSAVAGMMAVIVTAHVTKRGPVLSGDIVHIVMVHTNPGYGPNPGHPGTGTIVATLC